MMLRALYELAEREGLLEDPDCERHRVDLRIRLSSGGGLLAVEQVSDGRDALVSAVPRIPKRSGLAVRPGLLFDLSGYVLGAGKDAERRAAAFRELTRQVADATGDPGVRAVAAFLGDRGAVLSALARRAEWSGAEWTGFTLAGDGDAFVHERPAVRAYWRAQRNRSSGGAAPLRCLVTGEVAEPVRLHGSVRMPGTKGAVLVSFNDASSCLHGVEQGGNAPISRAAAEGYVTALNWLLERVGERRHRQAVPLGDGTFLVYWTRDPHAILDAVPALLEDVGELVAAPWRSTVAPPEVERSAFYAAVLGTNRTRIVVRDWCEATIGTVAAALDAYAADLRLDTREAPIPAIGALLRAAGDAPPEMGARIFRAAIRGGPFPRVLLASTLRALNVSRDGVGLRTRCALIKAVLLRLPNHGSAREVPVSIDENKRDVPYLLGRLFAVLEHMQWAAHGASVSATLRDRYFRAAASTPAMIFPRLLDLSVHHASKIARRGRGVFLELVKAQVVDALPAERFPRAMSIEDQGLFAIGYYHQRQRLFQRPEAPEPDAVDPPAPQDHQERAPAQREGPSKPAPVRATEGSTKRTKKGTAESPAKPRPTPAHAHAQRAPKRRSAPRET